MEKSIIAAHAPVNGINMYYEIHGEGNMPLVLIHGGGSTIETNYGVLIPLLSKNRKIIAVELQAHGRTSDRDKPETFEQDADDVAGLLKYLKINKADFFGFSNGGTTTLQIAIRHQALVNKIIVVSANYQREGLITGFFDAMDGANLDNMPGPLKEGYLKVNPDKDGLLAMFNHDRNRMINYKDIPDDLIGSIKAPALLIDGDQDVVTVEHMVKMARLLPNARLAILPGTHGSFIGEICSIVPGSRTPEMTANLVEEFLNGIA